MIAFGVWRLFVLGHLILISVLSMKRIAEAMLPLELAS